MGKGVVGIFRADASSCNGCDIEILAAISPRYGTDKLGVTVVEAPEEANVLLVTGGGNIKISEDLKRVYGRLRSPKTVVAIGSCAVSWNAFAGGYSIFGPVDQTIPVDVYVCGCPPRPQAIVEALSSLLGAEVNKGKDFWGAPASFRGKHHLDAETCVACGACEQSCPTKAIEITGGGENRLVTYLLGKCSYCRTCELVCPFEAVRLTQDYNLAFADKNEAKVEATIPMSRCSGCGAFFISSRQVDGALGRVEEKVDTAIEFKADLRRAMGLCLECRNQSDNIKMAKGLLARLTSKESESSKIL